MWRGSTLAAAVAAALTIVGGTVASNRPPVSLTAAPARATDKTEATFRWKSTRRDVQTFCGLNHLVGSTVVEGRLRRCASPARFKGLVTGDHVFRLVAVRRGHTIARIAYRWSIRHAAVAPVTSPPPAAAGGLNLSFTSTPARNSNSVSATFAWDVTDSAATLLCSFDGGAWFSCRSPLQAIVLGGGSHTFSVRASTASATSAISYDWTVTPTASGAGCAVAPYTYVKPVQPLVTTAEQQFIDLVNQARATLPVPLPPLSLNVLLTLAADSHSFWQDVALGVGLSHEGCGDSDPGQRIADTGYHASVWGEVTLIRDPPATAQMAFTMFKNSPGHWALLTSPSFKEIGVGQSTTHWTAELASP